MLSMWLHQTAMIQCKLRNETTKRPGVDKATCWFPRSRADPVGTAERIFREKHWRQVPQRLGCGMCDRFRGLGCGDRILHQWFIYDLMGETLAVISVISVDDFGSQNLKFSADKKSRSKIWLFRFGRNWACAGKFPVQCAPHVQTVIGRQETGAG